MFRRIAANARIPAVLLDFVGHVARRATKRLCDLFIVGGTFGNHRRDLVDRERSPFTSWSRWGHRRHVAEFSNLRVNFFKLPLQRRALSLECLDSLMAEFTQLVLVFLDLLKQAWRGHCDRGCRNRIDIKMASQD